MGIIVGGKVQTEKLNSSQDSAPRPPASEAEKTAKARRWKTGIEAKICRQSELQSDSNKEKEAV